MLVCEFCIVGTHNKLCKSRLCAYCISFACIRESADARAFVVMHVPVHIQLDPTSHNYI